MFRIIFLLLFLMGSAAFAQSQEIPKPVKFDEFETATNGDVKMKMDAFYAELNNNPAAQGYIINYGTKREIAIRRNQISVSIAWRKFDGTRITIVDGGFRDGVKSELWIVPPGAENPQPSSNAKIIEAFGKVLDGDLTARLQFFNAYFANDPKLKGYILIYGSAKSIVSQQSRIKRIIKSLKLNSARVTFKNAGSDDGGKTEFWLISANDKNESKTKIWVVPPGAKTPTQ